MRCTQFIGLNPWAENFLRENRKLIHTRKVVNVLPDGTEESQPDEAVREIPKRPTGNKWIGMFDDGGDLHEYTLLDGKKVTEYVQASPWSSGPCIFLALRDETGSPVPESLWDDKEIDNC